MGAAEDVGGSAGAHSSSVGSARRARTAAASARTPSSDDDMRSTASAMISLEVARFTRTN